MRHATPAQERGHELLAGHEADRAADDRAGRDAIRRRHPPEGEIKVRLPEDSGRFSSARRPAASAP